MYLFDKRKKLINDWNKGNLSAQDFVNEMDKKKLNWNDVEQLDEDDQSSDAPKPGKQNGRLALIALLMAIASLLLLSALGLWTYQQLAQQREGLAKVRENVENVPRITPQAVEKAKARISALETAVAAMAAPTQTPQPAMPPEQPSSPASTPTEAPTPAVQVDKIEFENPPQVMYVGQEPVELRVYVAGQNIEGRSVTFSIAPSELSQLLIPNKAQVSEQEAKTMLYPPDRERSFSITAEIAGKRATTALINVYNLPQIDVKAEAKQIALLSGAPGLEVSFRITNKSKHEIRDLVLICDKPNWGEIITPGDEFNLTGDGKIGVDLESLPAGDSATKKAVFTVEENASDFINITCNAQIGALTLSKPVSIEMITPQPAQIVIQPVSLPEIGINMPTSLRAKVMDQSGNPLADQIVTWNVPLENGTVFPNSSTTDIMGVVTATLTPKIVGLITITATVSSDLTDSIRLFSAATATATKKVHLYMGDTSTGEIARGKTALVIAKEGEQFFLVHYDKDANRLSQGWLPKKDNKNVSIHPENPPLPKWKELKWQDKSRGDMPIHDFEDQNSEQMTLWIRKDEIDVQTQDWSNAGPRRIIRACWESPEDDQYRGLILPTNCGVLGNLKDIEIISVDSLSDNLNWVQITIHAQFPK